MEYQPSFKKKYFASKEPEEVLSNSSPGFQLYFSFGHWLLFLSLTVCENSHIHSLYVTIFSRMLFLVLSLLFAKPPTTDLSVAACCKTHHLFHFL